MNGFIFTIGCVISLIFGMIIGYRAGIFHMKEREIGTLRIDRSIEGEEPYVFLEIDLGQKDKIIPGSRIVLRVSDENYIPRD